MEVILDRFASSSTTSDFISRTSLNQYLYYHLLLLNGKYHTRYNAKRLLGIISRSTCYDGESIYYFAHGH